MFLLLFGSGIIYFLLMVASLRCILTGYTMLPGETQVLSHTLAHLFLERSHPCGNGDILVSGFSGCLRFRLFSELAAVNPLKPAVIGKSWKLSTHANSVGSAVSLCCAGFFLPSVSIKHFFNAMPTTHISQLYNKKYIFFSSFGSLHWSIRLRTSDMFSA